VFESRYAEGKIERLPELAGELVRRQVDVIVAVSTPAGLAARHATSTIPIVVAGSGDMVDSGLVATTHRPGGNVTASSFSGVSWR
jgi:putative ABC transport system substrate-binding protein